MQRKYLRRDIIPSLSAIILSIALVTVNIFRIINIPITIDETGYYPHYTYYNLLRSTDGNANNHILHSVIRKFFVETFTENLFFLRLDSLIAQFIFLLFSWLLSRALFKNKWWALFVFILLNTISPLIFDFWGLSRGYALSLALMIVSIYCLIRYMAGNRILLLSISFATAVLAALSNFGYINYFIALSGVLVIQNIIFKRSGAKSSLFKEITVLFFAVIAFALLIIEPLKNVYRNGELVFLGNVGFIHDTVKTLIMDGLFLHDQPFHRLIKFITWSVVILTCAGGFYWLCVYLKKEYYKKEATIEAKYGITLFLLLIIPVISLLLQHHLLGINYLIGRTALFFILLFILQFIYWLHYLKPVIPKIIWAILLSVVLAAGYNFSFRSHTNYAYLWWFDMDDLNVLKRMTEESKNKPGKIKIKVCWLFTPSFNYDIRHHFNGRFYPVEDYHDNPGNDTTFDYYYIASSEVTNMMTDKYHKDTDFVYGGYVLYKKN